MQVMNDTLDAFSVPLKRELHTVRDDDAGTSGFSLYDLTAAGEGHQCLRAHSVFRNV